MHSKPTKLMRKLKLRSFLYRYLLSTVEKLITKRTGKNDVKLIYDNSTFKDTRHKRQIYLTYKVALTDWWFQNSNLHLPTVFLCGNYNVITYCKQISTQQLMVNKNKLEENTIYPIHLSWLRVNNVNLNVQCNAS